MLTDTNSVNTAQNKTFTYNLLDLPQTVKVAHGLLTYTYDATGNKLRKVSVINGVTKTTDYISGIEYDGATTDTLNFIQTEEGKAAKYGAVYDYTYYLGDNLGNTRVTFGTKTNTVVTYQKDDYYPFGMEIIRTAGNPKNEYLYNKKELQEETQEYDYGARYYDPVIARWTTIDPLAEISRRWSPYNYVENDPVRFTDPDGMNESDENIESDEQRYSQEKNYQRAGEKNPYTTALGSSVNSCCDVKPEVSNTFVNEKGELIPDIVNPNPGGGGISIPNVYEYTALGVMGYFVIKLFSSNDNPVADLESAYQRAKKLNFRDATANEGLANELQRNGYRNRMGDREDENDRYIYRGGVPSDGNLTPRPKDLDGLSAWTTAQAAKSAGSGNKFATKISVNSLRLLGLQVDFQGAHASIRPATPKELAAWAATKVAAGQGQGSHIYTKLVQASVRGVE